jgi:hypothetical protein
MGDGGDEVLATAEKRLGGDDFDEKSSSGCSLNSKNPTN